MSTILAFVLQSCDTQKATEVAELNNVQQNFKTLLDYYHSERKVLYPLESTAAGEDTYNDILPNNISSAYRKKMKSFYETKLNELSKIDRTQLTDKEQLRLPYRPISLSPRMKLHQSLPQKISIQMCINFCSSNRLMS